MLMRFFAGLILLLGTLPVAAQIRLISPEKRDSINNPQLVAASPLHFPEGAILDFGKLSEDAGVWRATLRWRNTGKTPVVLTRITTTCGCLKGVVDSYRPVAAGEKRKIDVAYHPKGHPGKVFQRLFIYTNLSERHPSAILQVKGVVEPSHDRSSLYPIVMGPLLLRTDRLTGTADKPQTWRIACLNSGRSALRLQADTLLTPRGFRLKTDPELLEAGMEGDLIISVDPNPQLRRNMPLRVVIGGLSLPPRERTVRIDPLVVIEK